MPEPLDVWIGKEEYGGVPTPTKRESKPPPNWRLEAIAATERPRSFALAPDGRTLVFIQDRDTSDLWRLVLGSSPERLTTGRDPMPYWEDTTPAVSPDGETVAYADQGAIWLVSIDGGPPKRLLEAGSPVWLDERTLVVSMERDDTSRLAVVDVDDPWPRRLVRTHGDLDPLGEEWGAAVSPDGSSVAYTFQPRADLNRSEIRVVSLESGEARALGGAATIHDRGARWSPDGSLLAYASESSGWYELHIVGADGSGARRLTHDDADFFEHRWHPDGDRLVATRGRHGRYDLVLVDASSGDITELASGGAWADPHWTTDGSILATYEGQATPPELRLVTAGSEPKTLHAPAPLAVRTAPHVAPEEIAYRSFDGVEVHGYLFRPSGASAEKPAPAVVYPHGGPISAYGDEWDGHAQYFVDKGYAWLAPNYRGSTGYGRDFERLLHGQVGVDDTKDCLAAADYLRTLDWVDGSRLAIFGASWGSFISLLAVTDDPEHRFRCAVCKYGDSNFLTSWSQGDRGGVHEAQENLAGSPAESRDAYERASGVHRLEQVEVPILVAHGEKDERVHPKQSEELVAGLERLGKTYEYVTYPTEAHGLLRAGPQIDFYRRLERFLDWYLL